MPYFLSKKQFDNLAIFSLVIIGIFLIALTLLVVKDKANGTCASTRITEITVLDPKTLDLELSSNESYLQNIPLDLQEINYYEYYLFCFNGFVNATDLIKIDILDQEKNILASDYLSNFSGLHCVDIGNQSFNTKNNYLGVSCANCNVDNKLSLYTIAKQVPTINNIGFSSSSQIDYTLIGVKNCKKFSYRLFKWMFFFILSMTAILGIDVLLDYIKGLSFDGW